MTHAAPEGLQTPTVDDITNWLRAEVAFLLEVDPAAIDPAASFESYGLASSDAVFLSGGLSDFIGLEISATLAWDHPNLRELAEFLAKVARGEAELPDDAPDWDLDSDLFS